MEITFKTKKLEKRCNTRREAVKEWGARMAEEVSARLQDLEAADTLEDLSPFPPTRVHPLKGNRAGQFAIDLVHPFRLVFIIDHEPVPSLPDKGVDRSAVTRIRVEDIGVDYH